MQILMMIIFNFSEKAFSEGAVVVVVDIILRQYLSICYCTVLYSTVQYSSATVQYSTVLPYSTVVLLSYRTARASSFQRARASTSEIPALVDFEYLHSSRNELFYQQAGNVIGGCQEVCLLSYLVCLAVSRSFKILISVLSVRLKKYKLYADSYPSILRL